jgi:hypothetical protein
MLFSRRSVISFLTVVSTVVMTTPVTALGSDYLDTAPITFYEDQDEMSPRNMDFDRVNNMFVAHSGW